MAQQTAVDFLLTELDIAKLIEREKLTMAAEVVRQAKAMEKEQMEHAFIDGGYDGLKFPKVKEAFDRKYLEDKFIKYYNKTYESNT
jgi:hypothetical protein